MNLINKIESQRDKKVNIDDKYFDDQFLDIFDQNNYILELSNTQTGGNLDIKNIYTQIMLKNHYIFKSYLPMLYKNMYHNIAKKYNLNLNDYTSIIYSDRLETDNIYVPNNNFVMNTEINNKYDNILLIIDFNTQFIEQNKSEFDNLIQNIINKNLNSNGNLLLFYMYDQNLEYLYNSFDRTIIYFPVNVTITSPKVVYILNNKTNNSNSLNKSHLLSFNNKIMSYLDNYYKLLINLEILRKKNKQQYKIIKVKIFTKLLS